MDRKSHVMWGKMDGWTESPMYMLIFGVKWTDRNTMWDKMDEWTEKPMYMCCWQLQKSVISGNAKSFEEIFEVFCMN
jgi:hypothetical protein